jgi:hypothetical protein
MPQLRYLELPERRGVETTPAAPTIPDGFETEYDRMPSDLLRSRYNAEPAFRTIVDLLLLKRGQKDA